MGRENIRQTGPLAASLSGPVLKRSVSVAIIIGTLLNAINQGDVIIEGGTPVFWKLALTYLVPFAVATYGAYAALAVTSPPDAPD